MIGFAFRVWKWEAWMATMKALKVMGRDIATVVDTPVPALRPGYVLVKVVCVALNLCDAKNVFVLGQDVAGTVLGTDYAGVVEETGIGYSKIWKKGDRIFGFVMGGNVSHPTDGAFAEYAAVKADVQYSIPHGMDFEEAASLGVSLSTAAMGICHKLHIELDLEKQENEITEGEKGRVFIYGGSTATGTMGIQLAKLAGWVPITTCSPHNFSLVSSYGAEVAFDYHDPRCASKIASYSHKKISRAFDCITSCESARLCADVLSNDLDTAFCSTLPLNEPFAKKKVIPKRLLLWSGLGEKVRFMGYEMPVVPEDFVFLKRFTLVAEGLLEDGDIRAHPMRKMDGGIEALMTGLIFLYDGNVSGQKLVYTLGSA